MIRLLAALFLVMHGIVHVIGFLVPWRLATFEGAPYTTLALWDSIDLGEVGALALGVAWLLLVPAFLNAAYGIWRARNWALAAIAVTTAASLAVCLLGSPRAIIGVVLDVAILVVIGAWFLLRREPGAERRTAHA